jgi:hypothetical protein
MKKKLTHSLTHSLTFFLSVMLFSGCSSLVNDSQVETETNETFKENVYILGTEIDNVTSLRKISLAETNLNKETEINNQNRVTFMSRNEYYGAVAAIEDSLQSSSFRKKVPVPLDYSCKINLSAMFWLYGTLVVENDTIVSTKIMKEQCVSLMSDSTVSLSRIASSALKWPSSNVTISVNNKYKMVGESWNQFGGVGYASSGGKTTFHKYREKYWFLGKRWYELDADRISIRVYYFDCLKFSASSTGNGVVDDFTHSVSNSCTQWGPQASSSDVERNSGYTEEKVFAVDVGVSGTVNNSWSPVANSKTNLFDYIAGITGMKWINKIDDDYSSKINKIIPSLPPVFRDGAAELSGMAHWFKSNISGQAARVSVPVKLGYVKNKVPSAVISLHSVNHGSMRFRAMSSSGLNETPVLTDRTSWEYK